MLPNLIVIDKGLLSENGQPEEGARVYFDHIRVHPENLEKTIDGLKKMTGKEFKVIESSKFQEDLCR
jgi:hypothetical protein